MSSHVLCCGHDVRYVVDPLPENGEWCRMCAADHRVETVRRLIEKSRRSDTPLTPPVADS